MRAYMYLSCEYGELLRPVKTVMEYRDSLWFTIKSAHDVDLMWISFVTRHMHINELVVRFSCLKLNGCCVNVTGDDDLSDERFNEFVQLLQGDDYASEYFSNIVVAINFECIQLSFINKFLGGIQSTSARVYICDCAYN